jgi:hypothetical protein
MRNGVTFMSVAAALALLYTGGDVSQLVVMYSINVFATFAMSNLAMLQAARQDRRDGRPWRSGLIVHLVGFVLCVGILGVTIFEKFLEGGWVTLLVTAAVVAGCLWVRAHYDEVRRRIAVLDPVDPLTRVSSRPSPLACPRSDLRVDHRRPRRVDRCERADLVHRMVVDHAEHRVQVLPRIQPVQTAAADQ